MGDREGVASRQVKGLFEHARTPSSGVISCASRSRPLGAGAGWCRQPPFSRFDGRPPRKVPSSPPIAGRIGPPRRFGEAQFPEAASLPRCRTAGTPLEERPPAATRRSCTDERFRDGSWLHDQPRRTRGLQCWREVVRAPPLRSWRDCPTRARGVSLEVDLHRRSQRTLGSLLISTQRICLSAKTSPSRACVNHVGHSHDLNGVFLQLVTSFSKSNLVSQSCVTVVEMLTRTSHDKK